MSSGSTQPAHDVLAQSLEQTSGAPVSPAAESVYASPLDQLLTGATATARVRFDLDYFLGERDPAKALRYWLGGRASADRREIALALGRDIARLDQILTAQANEILHHADFQKLESSWRGLYYLVEQTEDHENVKIRVLNVSWRELARDAERAIEFDGSQLFQKVYSEEFGTPGGEPYSVLIGDYDIHPRPTAEHPIDDVSVLTSISQVAAASFAPFIASAHPSMFGLDSYSELAQPLNLSRTFDQLEYLKWRAFRDTEDSRFVGLTLPRVLARLPYDDNGSRVDRFRFSEDVTEPDGSRYVWMNASYAFAGVLIRAYVEAGWLANICGTQQGVIGGGLTMGLPVHEFATDPAGVALKFSTETVITEQREKEFGDLGFIPLCPAKDTEYCVFYSAHSVQKPKKYDTQIATTNAQISGMLQYMLCVSRFAHYIKVLIRDKVGAFLDAEQCEDYLQRWLVRYVSADPHASAEIKSEFPLREARIQVRPHPGKPGTYLCVVHLWPHFELDQLVAAVKLTTELSAGAVAGK
jgi:type VI secretion system ImpC/EvpB family protein